MNKKLINSIIVASLLANPALVAFAQTKDYNSSKSNTSAVSPVPAIEGRLEKREIIKERADAVRGRTREGSRERVNKLQPRKFLNHLEEGRQKREGTKEEFGINEDGVNILQQRRARIRKEAEKRRVNIEEKRKKLRSLLETRKEELKKKRGEHKEELRIKLEKVKNEKKRKVVERLDDRFSKINTKFTNHLFSALTRLEELLSKVSSRADKAESRGVDVSAVRSAVDQAHNDIAAARAVLEEQLVKIYSINVTDESTLRSVVAEARDLLNQDLRAAREIVRAAHKSVVEALKNLKSVPKIDEYEDSSVETANENQAGNGSE